MSGAWPAARRLLVLAPHPDDETIAAWALMRHLRRRGAQVTVVVVSDGAASHPGSRTWPPRRLAARRRRETLNAMRAIGIGRRAVRFLDLPDGALRVEGVRRAIMPELRHALPDLIVAPERGDAHGDHAAVAAALAQVRRRGERRLGYRVWPLATAARGPSEAIRLDARALAGKRLAIRGYRTQTGTITDADAGFAMTHRHIAAFARPLERFSTVR